jgi:outer membrane lipoprotein-sorting protein
MKTKLILATTLLILATLPGRSQDMKLDDVLNAYYKAVGIEKMKDWQTITGTCKMVGQPMETPVKVFIKRPDKVRVEVEVQGSKMIQVLNGNSGWSITPWSGSSDPQDMTADEVKSMKDQADIEGAMYNWKEKGHKAELIGKEDLEGSSVYKIKVTKADGDIETYYIDADSFVPLKQTSITKVQGNEQESETFFSNYSDFNGVLMAKTITNKFKGQIVSTLQFDKMEFNLPMSDDLFVKPALKK